MNGFASPPVPAVETARIPAFPEWVATVLLWRCLRFLFGSRGGNEGAIARTQPSYRFFWIVRRVCIIFFTLYNRITVEGQEHIPADGPLVMACNHAAALDGFILCVGSPRPVHIMVKKEGFENPFAGWLLRKSLAFPVDRSKPEGTAIKHCLKVLQDGQILGLFPEGTRNRNGLVRPFKPGTIRLAIKQKVRILPCFISGNHKLSPPGTFFPRPAKMQVAYGPAVDVPALLAQGKTEQEIQDQLYEKVIELGGRLTGKDVRDLSDEITKDGRVPVAQAGSG